MITEPLKQLATTGVLGLLLVIALIAIWWLHTLYQRSMESRVKDNADALAVVTKMQELVNTGNDRIAELVERDREREIRERERDARTTGGRTRGDVR